MLNYTLSGIPNSQNDLGTILPSGWSVLRNHDPAVNMLQTGDTAGFGALLAEKPGSDNSIRQSHERRKCR